MGGNYRVDPRVHAQIGMTTLMSDKVKFSPNISYQKIMGSPANSFVSQGMLDYLHSKEKGLVLKGGLGYRSGAGIGDAVQLMLGADIKVIRVMLGYDINISQLVPPVVDKAHLNLPPSMLARYLQHPGANPDPIIFCPRF